MKISVAPSNKWRLQEAPFPYQQTYATPLEDLPNFVRTITTPFDLKEGKVHIELIVFKPSELIWYLKGKGIITNEGELNRSTIQAENTEEALELLECALGQWTDFAFIPSPMEFAIYADHDEYTTVFTANQQTLDSLQSSMQSQGFKTVDGWVWTGPHSSGDVEGSKNDV